MLTYFPLNQTNLKNFVYIQNYMSLNGFLAIVN